MSHNSLCAPDKIPTGRYKQSTFDSNANNPKRASRIRGFKTQVTCKIATRGIVKEKRR
jgi:hypothetical protein